MLCPALLGGGWLDGWRDGWVLWMHACTSSLLEWRRTHCTYHVHLFCVRRGSPPAGDPFGACVALFLKGRGQKSPLSGSPNGRVITLTT